MTWSCCRNRPNRATTKPNPIKARPVRIQARKVRSAASASRKSGLWVVSVSPFSLPQQVRDLENPRGASRAAWRFVLDHVRPPAVRSAGRNYYPDREAMPVILGHGVTYTPEEDTSHSRLP